jgi:carboxylesterase
LKNPNLEPSEFFLDGGPVGTLLIHGFTGSPPEMRMVGDYLHQHGLTVSGPRLPGHGTTIEDLNRRSWQEWTDHAQRALTDLQARCEAVFVGGLSMGALLALYLAAYQSDMAGAIAYSPATIPADRRSMLAPILKYVIRQAPKGEDDLNDPQGRERIWSYDAWPSTGVYQLMKLTGRVKHLLPEVKCPVLIIYSTADQTIHPNSASLTYRRIGSADKELVTLHQSGHVITVDSEWELVAQQTYQFVQAHLPDNASQHTGYSSS